MLVCPFLLEPIGNLMSRSTLYVLSLASALLFGCGTETPTYFFGPFPSDTPGNDADGDAEAASDTSSDVAEGDAADAESVDVPSDAPSTDVPSEDTERSGADAEPADAVSDPIEEPDAEPEPWRSVLFPAEWQPHESHVDAIPGLADYSYAGYAAGVRAEGAPEDAAHFEVADFGLLLRDDGTVDSEADNTAALQAAIDAAEAAGGGVVDVPAGLIRLDGTLQVSASGVVIRGEGPDQTELMFTRSEGMVHNGHLTVGTTPRLGDSVPLLADAAAGAFEVTVSSDAGVEPGDEIALGFWITDEFIERHRMTDVWGAFNGTWQPFAWRTVLETRDADDSLVLTLDVPLREPHALADRASVRVVSGAISECGIEDLALSNAVEWHTAWETDQVHAVEMRGVRNSWIRNVRSFASPLGDAPETLYPPHLQSSGVLVFQSRHVTIRDVHLANSQHRGGGGNGYLFEIRQSNEVLTVDSTAENGRHNFIQNWGFGTSGCVWLRVHSAGSAQTFSPELPGVVPAASEFHHSLATSNLIDQSTIDDGWYAENRGDWSSGAGITAWANVFWNVRGEGEIHSRQWGVGYVIGTSPAIRVLTSTGPSSGVGTEPEDWVEGEGLGEALEPASLYEAQLERRLGSIPD